jgi:4-amino-4-deoxy-L-arabinose transferase-like glycosyltransferase
MGAHDAPLYLLSQLMVGGGLVASWLLARDLLRHEAHSERLALVAVAALEGVHYYSLSSVEFNANVVMYPFWAGATLCAWRALTPHLRPSAGAPATLGWWLDLGLCTGLGLLGKYVFALLPLALLAFMLLNSAGRGA